MDEDETTEGSGGFIERRKRVEGGRHRRHVVRVTDAEEARLQAMALERRVSVPKLLVDAALSVGDGDAIPTRREQITELFHVARLLGTLANNMNQIARVANATGQVDPGLPATLAKVREAADRLEDALECERP